MHHTPMAAAVGVELGSSTVNVLIRRGDEATETRRVDGGAELETILRQVRAVRDEAGGGPAHAAFAVPASWGAGRRQELVYLADETGFGDVEVITAPEAAAVFYTGALGRAIEPGEALVVCDLGARSFEVAVVVRTEHGYDCRALAGTPEVAGREFDQLLLAYLSGRYRDTDPEFWDKVETPDDTDEAALRESLLAEIRTARELTSKRPKVGVQLPIGERDLHLTREEVESCIGELLAQSADLVAATIAEARATATGILLVGGASRTPLLASMLTARTGIEPVVPARPDTAVAEGALYTALDRIPVTVPDDAPRRHLYRRLGVLSAVLLPMVAAGAVFGSGLGDDESPEAGSTSATEASTAVGTTGATSETEDGTGGSGGQDGPGSPQAAPEESTSAAESATPGESTEESAASGTVPDVTGMTANEAETALNDADYTNVDRTGEEESVFGPWYDDCEVIEQDPAAGEALAFSAQITITYSYSGSDASVCD